MPDTPLPDRYRTVPKKGRPADVPRDSYRLVLPPSYVQAVKWELILERHRVAQTTVDGVRNRAVDEPVQGLVAVLPRDEREAAKGKALAYIDATPGRMPVIVMGGEQTYWQELKDEADETRHYGLDQLPDRDRPDAQTAWQDRVEQDDRARRGVKTYGATTAGQL